MARIFPKFGYNPVTGEWNDSLKGRYCWSNVNLNEGVPDVMTPASWSLLWSYVFEIHPIDFPEEFPVCGNICGRPYFNLSLVASLYHAVGRDARQEMFGDLLGSTPPELEIPYIPLSPLAVLWMALPGTIRDQLRARRDAGKLADSLAMLPGWCRTVRGRIEACPDAAGLLSLWKGTIRPMFLQDFRLLRSMTLNLSAQATPLNRELTALVGEAETNVLLSNLAGEGSALESLGPLLGLARVKAGRLSRAEYMQRYGHRGAHETELFAPDSEDDPDWLDRKLADLTASAADVEARLAAQRARGQAAWRGFAERFPDQFASFRRRQERLAHAAQDREAIRSGSIRLSRLLRRFLLRAGEVSGTGEGIFFLTLDEMAGLLAGDRAPLRAVAARRMMYERYSALPTYPALIYGRFDPFQWAADPGRRSDFYDERQAGRAAPPAAIKGYAGAAGCVEGRVRRIDCVEQGGQILPGEILVTTNTNVGWTPLFPRLAAIVTDVGAPLSHATIIARELGIPAVVGCGNASMLLKTGDRVRVDGGRGVVELLERAA